MTPEQFNQISANLHTDAEMLHRFVAEAVRVRSENERLTAELDQLRAGLDGLLEKLRDDQAAEVVRVTGTTQWPGE